MRRSFRCPKRLTCGCAGSYNNDRIKIMRGGKEGALENSFADLRKETEALPLLVFEWCGFRVIHSNRCTVLMSSCSREAGGMPR